MIDKFFQEKNYRLQVEVKREIYQDKNNKGLVWEFQAFNKLFKVDKYVYFFKHLPTLKNNRIHIVQEDFDFLVKVVDYYEKRKGVDQGASEQKKNQVSASADPIPKDTDQERSPPPSPNDEILIEKEKNIDNTEKINSLNSPNPSSPSNLLNPPTPSSEVKGLEVEERSIDDLYQVEKSYKIDYVFIDPGHGGRDPGATFYGYVEKDLTLSLSQELAHSLIEENPDFNVVLTRNDDRYLSLEQRCAIANQSVKSNENGIFISIHLNVWVDPEARGIEVFYLTGDEKVIQNKTYRHLEDLAGAREGYFKKIFSYLKVIQYQMESRFLSYQIIKNIESNIKASIPRGYKDETFYVLKGALMPSVLLELGFISNRKDMEILNDRDKRKKILKQISTAVMKYAADFKESNGFRDDFYFNKFLSLE